jgi:hypothetical protein
MTLVFSDSSTKQGLVEHLKFVSGQDSLNINDATRLLNFALDDYSSIAMASSGKWKFDDTTNTTNPIATATLNAGEEHIPLDIEFLMVDQVQILIDGKYEVLEPIDPRDDKENVLASVYDTAGKPRYYDYDAHNLYFYPKSDTTRTVKVRFSRAANHFDVTDTNASIGIPSIHYEYLSLKAAQKLGFRINDDAMAMIERELIKWEGVDGQGGKIRDFYSKRDQDTPRRLKAKINVPR